METKTKEKRGLAAIFALCPRRWGLLALSAALIALHLLTRRDRALMVTVSENLVRPLHRALSGFNARFPFSVAELLIALAVAAAAAYLAVQIALLIKRPERAKRLFKTLLTFVSAVAAIYALFCLMWGVYYYAGDFASKSGFVNEPVSVEQLRTVTEFFAAGLNEYAPQVPRDGDGICRSDRRAILEKSPEVFAGTEEKYPCLAGPEVAAKGVVCSRVMSYIDFTGFFFPFTAEANVNTDSPECDFAATVAHELSHQRGVAREQEANFVAVLASLEYGDPDYCYSACMLAYIHLSNALWEVDPEGCREIYLSLDENVRRDLEYRRAYWRRFDTPVRSVSNTVYEGFLQSYDQELGLRSYGACVDLLVNYYYDRAKAG